MFKFLNQAARRLAFASRVSIVGSIFSTLLLASIVTSSYAITESQALGMVQANPGILNTPAAQAALAERGMTSDDVTSLLDSSSVQESGAEVEIEVNNVSTSSVTNESPSNGSGRIYANPLAYKSNADLLGSIKSAQNVSTGRATERFSSAFFRNKNNQDQDSLPVPDYYVVSQGDELSIWVYGVTEVVIETVVDSYGNVNIPISGPLQVAGLSFADVKSLIVSKLQTAYPNSSIIVNISKYSTIQVSLIGNVNAPGVYNVSALSTVKDLLIQSGGVKGNGTVRSITLQRQDGSIYVVDLYDLLTNKNIKPAIFLKTGDLIYIPNAYKIISIAGAVYNPAKFELKRDEKLDQLLEYAGGITAKGSKHGLKVEGYYDGQAQVKTVDASSASAFDLNNGDSVYVYPIDKVGQVSISVFGNVVRPGERGLNKEMSLAKLISDEVDTFGLDGVFLDNTLFNFAMIKRKTDSLSYEFVRVDLADVLSGNVDETLRSGDELYVFNKLDNELNPFVKIGGAVVMQGGEFQFIEGMTVSDLIQIAGTNGPYDSEKIKLISYQTNDLMPKVSILTEAQASLTTLSMFDEVEIFDFYGSNVVDRVAIAGSVVSPRGMVLGKGMKLKDLIFAAGGLSKNAFYDRLRLTRTHNIDGVKFESEELNLPLADVLKDGKSNIALQDKDSVYIYSIDEANDREGVTIKGEIRMPGKFFIGQGMVLNDLILAAGGYTDKAFLEYAEVIRYSVKDGERTKEIKTLDLSQGGDFIVNNFDEVTIFTIPKWHEKKTVTLSGQVRFPGVYTINDGDRLTDVIVRAGGFTDRAFLYGASFTRESVKEMQRLAIKDSVDQLKKKIAMMSAQPREAGEGAKDQGEMAAILAMLEEQGKEVRTLGRVTINLKSNVSESSNIVLNDGDRLHVPLFVDTVVVMGEVMSPTAIIYDSKSTSSYIAKAGGYTPMADDDLTYIIHANGEAELAGKSLFGALNGKIRAGDVIVVPPEVIITSGMQIAKDISSILYQFAISAASLKTVGVFQ